MLADMLLELNQPQQALAEYRVALKLSPNRFNGLYNAGAAAEAAGDKRAAAEYYAAPAQINRQRRNFVAAGDGRTRRASSASEQVAAK